MATDPELQQFYSNIKAMAQSMRELVTAQSNTTAANIANAAAVARQTTELELYERGLIKGRKLNAQQQELLKKALAAKKKELQADKDLEKSQKNQIDILKSQTASQQSKVDAATNVIFAQKTQAASAKESAKTSDTLERSFGRLQKSTDLANASLVWFGAALVQQGKQLVAQYKATSGSVEDASGTFGIFGSLLSQQNEALKRGVSGEDLQKISAASRQTINAMGGTDAAFKQLDPIIDKFRIMTLSNVEALKLATQSTEYFTKSGVKPTTDDLELYRKSLFGLTNQTGMSTQQASEYFKSMAEDADTVTLLRKARAGERDGILASQRAMMQNAIAVGMSSTQAKEATKMLQSMAAAKPIDRLKQAAKIRAFGGAMGIAGSEEAAQGVAAGSRATDQQKQAIMDFHQSATNAMDQSASQGMAAEIFATSLASKLDLEKYLGDNSPFSTSLGDALKPLTNTVEKYVDATTVTQGKIAGDATLAAGIVTQIATGNTYLGLIAAGVGVIAARLIGGKLMDAAFDKLGSKIGGKTGDTISKFLGTGESVAGKATGKLGEKVGTLADAMAKADKMTLVSKEAQAAGEVASKGGSLMSKVGTVAKVGGKALGAAGLVLDAGQGVNDLMNGKRQTELSGTDYISPVRWGMRAGEAINKTAEKLMGGESIGSKLYDLFNEDPKIQQDIVEKQRQATLLAAKKTALATSADTDANAAVLAKLQDKRNADAEIASANEAKLEMDRLKSKQPMQVVDAASPPVALQRNRRDPISGNAALKTSFSNELIKDSSQASADGIATQVKQIGTSNELLTKIAELSQKTVDLAEKQLVASTLTDKEKSDHTVRTNLRRENKFSSQYNYI